MQKLSCIILFINFFTLSFAQRITLIVPDRPIFSGTAFQVQYVIHNAADISQVNLPVFDSFQVVSGPHFYKGMSLINDKQIPIENITYTLIAARDGKIKLPGMNVKFKSMSNELPDTLLDIHAPAKASYSTTSNYTDISLYKASAHDIDQLIAQNLFLKIDVSKTTCYIGEPVIVTFTLFSRLESVSEATKSPGMYGFNIVDMLDINEPHRSVVHIDNKIFNTSVLRKMQVYPTQQGDLSIDPMHVENEVLFIDSLHKYQKISIKKELVSQQVIIHVKPLPPNAPDNFNGAVGIFTISAELKNKICKVNQPGKVIVKIGGQGNFMQFSSPEFPRVQHISFSEPVITDKMNKQLVPIKGDQVMMFDIFADKKGSYKLSPLKFSFFDPDLKIYKTISTDSLQFNVINGSSTVYSLTPSFVKKVKPFWLINASIAIVSLILFLLFFKPKRKKEEQTSQFAPEKNLLTELSELDVSLLEPKEAIYEIQKLLNRYLNENNKKLTEKQKAEIQGILSNTGKVLYSNDTESLNPIELKNQALRSLSLISDF